MRQLLVSGSGPILHLLSCQGCQFSHCVLTRNDYSPVLELIALHKWDIDFKKQLPANQKCTFNHAEMN